MRRGIGKHIGNYEPDKSLASSFEWVASAVYALIFVALFLCLTFRVVTVSGDSMRDTLNSGDRLLLCGLMYTPEHGDIVVVHRNDDTPLIKRVIALEGDTIRIDGSSGIVYRNGEALSEPYVLGGFTTTYGMDEEIVIPEGHIFVMGDNRRESLDSRLLGSIPMENLVGKVYFRISPNLGRIEE